jgi:hypothetical protein
LAWDCGAGLILNFLIRRRLVLNTFLFPVSTAKLWASSITISEALQMVIRASPILSFSLCCANTIGAAIRTLLIGEA